MFPDVKTVIEVGDRIFKLFQGTTTRMFGFNLCKSFNCL